MRDAGAPACARQGLAAAGYYISVSTALTVVVKMLFTAAGDALHVPFLLLSQALTVLLLFAAAALSRAWAAPALPRTLLHWRAYAPLLASYAGMLSSSVLALRLTSLLMYNTLRRTSLVFVVVAQALAHGALPTRYTAAATALTVGGAAYAGAHDSAFHREGYGLAIAANVTSAMYLVLLRPVRDEMNYTNSQLLFVNTLFIAPLLALFLAAQPSGTASALLPALRAEPGIAALYAAACGLAFLLNHSTYVNTTVNGAVAQTISAQVKDFLLLVVSVAFIDRPEDRTPRSVAGVLIAFLGSLVYCFGRLHGVWRARRGGTSLGCSGSGDAGSAESADHGDERDQDRDDRPQGETTGDAKNFGGRGAAHQSNGYSLVDSDGCESGERSRVQNTECVLAT